MPTLLCSLCYFTASSLTSTSSSVLPSDMKALFSFLLLSFIFSARRLCWCEIGIMLQWKQRAPRRISRGYLNHRSLVLYTRHSLFKFFKILSVIRVSSDGIATSYGLDGPGIESRWRRDFPHLSREALRPTHPPVQWVPCLSRGNLRPERDPSPTSSAEVKNRVELYLSSP